MRDPLKFKKCGQFFIPTNNKPLSVVAGGAFWMLKIFAKNTLDPYSIRD